MKIKLFNVLVIVFVIFSLISCGKIEETPNSSNIDIDDDKPIIDDPVVTPPDITGKTLFTVFLKYNKKIYIPEENEVINVIFQDEYTQYSEAIDLEGYAKIYLDGSFRVFLDNAPEGLAYNPNIYYVDNNNPTIEIELLKIAKPVSGKGTGLYDKNIYVLNTTGVYQTELTSKKQKVYYEFEPKQSGIYEVESIVNIYEDVVNPKIDVYSGVKQYKTFNRTIDDGGSSIAGGYTKNYNWSFNVSDQMIGNVYTFVVYADSKTAVYPVIVTFEINYLVDFEQSDIVSRVMPANEYLNAKIDPYDINDFPNGFENYRFINSDGGIGSYYGSVTNGSGELKGENFKYNEETKLWHVYDPVTNTFGPKLCAKITQPCAYFDPLGSPNYIESYGNKALTVSDGTENYKQFIEVYYSSICNEAGLCYVTMELKEFFQKFSISQRLFFDGYGFVEQTQVYALEEDQWLFACGYYLPNN